MTVTFLRAVPGLLALLASSLAVLTGLSGLCSGKDAKGLYWVVVGLLILRGIRSGSKTDSTR
jgi:hypothetical protein